jgi:hypothetical protein
MSEERPGHIARCALMPFVSVTSQSRVAFPEHESILRTALGLSARLRRASEDPAIQPLTKQNEARTNTQLERSANGDLNPNI